MCACCRKGLGDWRVIRDIQAGVHPSCLGQCFYHDSTCCQDECDEESVQAAYIRFAFLYTLGLARLTHRRDPEPFALQEPNPTFGAPDQEIRLREPARMQSPTAATRQHWIRLSRASAVKGCIPDKYLLRKMRQDRRVFCSLVFQLLICIAGSVSRQSELSLKSWAVCL